MTLDLKSPQFAAVASEWLAHIDARVEDDELSRHTSTAYWQVARYLIEHFDGVQLAEIGRRQVQEAIDNIRRGHGKSSARSALSRLKAMWQWAVDEEMTDIPCPAVRIRQPRQVEVRQPLPPEAAQRMAEVCWDALLEPHRRKPIAQVHAGFFLLIAGTGLRSSEGTHARFDEWDSVNRTLRITKHKCSRTRGPKVLNLGQAASFVLDHIIEQDWCAWLPERCAGQFFPSARSKRGHIEDPWRAWQALRTAAKLPEGTRIHDLRHGFADTVYAQCGDLWAVKSALGHGSIASTERYTSRTPKQLLVPVLDRASDALIGRPADETEGSDG